MIVKMTILRLLGSSDDKEKIGVARPEGPHLRSKGQELKRPWRNPSRKDQNEDNLLSPVKLMMTNCTHRCNEPRSSELGFGTGLTGVGCFTLTGWTDVREVEYVGAIDPGAEAKSIHLMNWRWGLGERRCSCPESCFFRVHRTTTLTD